MFITCHPIQLLIFTAYCNDVAAVRTGEQDEEEEESGRVRERDAVGEEESVCGRSQASCGNVAKIADIIHFLFSNHKYLSN